MFLIFCQRNLEALIIRNKLEMFQNKKWNLNAIKELLELAIIEVNAVKNPEMKRPEKMIASTIPVLIYNLIKLKIGGIHKRAIKTIINCSRLKRNKVLPSEFIFC